MIVLYAYVDQIGHVGTIPSSLGQLSELTFLNLHDNKLTGQSLNPSMVLLYVVSCTYMNINVVCNIYI